MLGRLAKWLRIIGLDVFYSNSVQDDELLELCSSEKRILLTRDTELARRAKKKMRVIFIEGDRLREQFVSLRGNLMIKPDASRLFSRCVACNTPLLHVNREEVEGRVPAFVFDNRDDFKTCPKCQKVYWKGSHVDHTMKMLDESLFGAKEPSAEEKSPASD